MPTRSHDEAMSEFYFREPGNALELMNQVLAEGAHTELLILLRQMTRAFGGVGVVAESAELNTTQLYRTLSAEGNPTLSSLVAVLKVMGLRLAVQPASVERESAA